MAELTEAMLRAIRQACAVTFERAERGAWQRKSEGVIEYAIALDVLPPAPVPRDESKRHLLVLVEIFDPELFDGLFAFCSTLAAKGTLRETTQGKHRALIFRPKPELKDNPLA